MCKKKTLRPVHQHAVIYILRSVTEPSDRIAEQILHALHASARTCGDCVGICTTNSNEQNLERKACWTVTRLQMGRRACTS